MQSVLSNTLLTALKPGDKPYEIRDTRLKGLLLRVQPSGIMTYYIEFGRGRRLAIGRADAITPQMARDKAKELIGDAFRGDDPIAAKRKGKDHTLETFITKLYEPWASANIRTSKGTTTRLRASFAAWLPKRLSEITAWQIEKWRAEGLKGGLKASTINRSLDDLRSCLNKAVLWEVMESNPLNKLKRLRVDPSPTVRYLSNEEEKSLRGALLEREMRIREARIRGNVWRAERGYQLLPDLCNSHFADYLRPMVLLSLNTGMRQGEVFGMKWQDIDLVRANLTIHGASAKSGKTRHIPLNTEAVGSLRHWHADTSASSGGLVFPSQGGSMFNNVRKAWLGVLKDAKISAFRWHDMRHTFASRLVMAGVDLNTVRELLGHADYKMTLRYAHLAPEHKAAAVAKLVQINA